MRIKVLFNLLIFYIVIFYSRLNLIDWFKEGRKLRLLRLEEICKSSKVIDKVCKSDFLH